MFLFLIFSFYHQGNYSISSNYAAHLQFGFEQNGFFSIQVYDCSLSHLIVHLLPYDDYLKAKAISSSNLSTSQYFSLLNFSEKGNQIYQDFVLKKDLYIVIFQANLSTYAMKASTYYLAVKYNFSNPNSLLDSRYKNLSIWIPVSLSLFFLIFAYWTINWFRHFTVQIGLHYIVTITIFLNFFFRLVQNVEYNFQNIYDSTPIISIISFIFRALSQSSKFFLLLLAAKGWCILKDSIQISQLLLSLITSVGFVAFEILIYYVELGSWVLLVLFLEIVCFVFYVHDLISSLDEANVQINTHLLSIDQRGIDSATTPVFQKHLMF